MLDVKNDNIEDRIFSEKNGNFQTMNMIYKIKNVKKKRKQQNNIKKMPFPEVLENINETEPEPANEPNNKKTVEGFEQYKFEYDDWDGYDNINKKKGDSNGKDIRQILIDYINHIYDSTRALNKSLAEQTVKFFYDNKSLKTEGNKNEFSDENRKNDTEKMYKYICVIEALSFSFLVVNNWYFLMFYNNFSGNKVKMFDFSSKMIKCLDEGTDENLIFKNGVLYFIEYALWFPVKLEWLLITVFPSLTKKWLGLSNTFNYIFLFLLIAICSYNMAFALKSFLIDCINANFKNLLVFFMGVMVVFLFLKPEGYIDCHEGEIELTEDQKKNIDKIDNFENLGDIMPTQNGYKEQIQKYTRNLNYKLDLLKKTEVEIKNLVEESKKDPINEPKYEKELLRKNAVAKKIYDEVKNIKQLLVSLNKKRNIKRVNGGNDDIEPFNDQDQDEHDYTTTSKFSGGFSATGTAKQAGTSVLKLLWNVIRFAIVFIISVPLGGILCVFYFIFYSLYAVIFYCNLDNNLMKETFVNVLKFIDNKKESDNPSETDTYFQKLVKKFYEYIEHISDNFVMIVYLITFIVFITDLTSIKNTKFREVLYGLIGGFIAISMGGLFLNIRSRYGSLYDIVRGIKPPEKDYNNAAQLFTAATYGIFAITMSVFIVYPIGLLIYSQFN
jgi:hypothetical protein